jgi:hypothetical protein
MPPKIYRVACRREHREGLHLKGHIVSVWYPAQNCNAHKVLERLDVNYVHQRSEKAQLNGRKDKGDINLYIHAQDIIRNTRHHPGYYVIVSE